MKIIRNFTSKTRMKSKNRIPCMRNAKVETYFTEDILNIMIREEWTKAILGSSINDTQMEGGWGAERGQG